MKQTSELQGKRWELWGEPGVDSVLLKAAHPGRQPGSWSLKATAFESSGTILTGSSIREAGLAGGDSLSGFSLRTFQLESITASSKPKPA